MSTARRANPWRRGALLALVATGASLLGAETWLRARTGVLPRPYALFEERSAGSYRNLPDHELAVWRGGRPISLRTNSHGQAGPETSIDRPAGVRRVAVLGDSFTYGLWASDVDHAFAGVARRRLRPVGVELLNFGACGFTFDDHRVALEEDALAFEPEIALICTFNGNDFWEAWLGPERNRVVDGVLVPNVEHHRERIPADLFRLPHGRIVRWAESPLGRVALYHAAHKMFAGSAEACPPPPPLVIDEEFLEPEHFYAFPLWSLKDPPPVVREASAAALGSLDELLDACESRGITPAVVAIPYARQVSVRDVVGAEHDLRLPQRHVEELCRRRGVAYLDLMPPLRKALREEPDRPLYVDGDTHFSDAGHAVAGELVAQFLGALLADTVALR